MTEFKHLKGGKPSLDQINGDLEEMRDILSEINSITENYLLSEMEAASRWCWDHKECFVTFQDAFKAYLEMRK